MDLEYEFDQYILRQNIPRPSKYIRVDLSPLCLDPNFFIIYSMKRYGITIEVSEKIRQLLLKEMNNRWRQQKLQIENNNIVETKEIPIHAKMGIHRLSEAKAK